MTFTQAPNVSQSRRESFRTRLLGERARKHTEEGNLMNKLSLLVGAAIGAMLTAGIAQIQAQAPAATTRPAVFVVTEQTLTDEKKYNDEYAPKVLKTIRDHGGRALSRALRV
jgi:hypothetical protein